MKTKPLKHKETNTFKFKPFSQRIADIDVDVFHRVAHRNEENEDIETNFHEALQKWNVQNLSQSYVDFRKEVSKIVTLPQLLNQKQHVVDTLVKYLKTRDPLVSQSIFELVIAVAKDLQKDFYAYFPEFLEVIISFLSTKDADQLEFALTSLAYLFKFLSRYLVKDFVAVFQLLVPLLDDKKPAYINDFAAESFSFIVRRIKDKEAFLKLVLATLEDNPGGVAGCGKLLFHVIFGVPGQFHSCAEQTLTIYFAALQDESINRVLLHQLLSVIVEQILKNIHPQKSEVLWTVFFKLLEKYSNSRYQDQWATENNCLTYTLSLIVPIIAHCGGKFVISSVDLINKLIQLNDNFESNACLKRNIADVSIHLLLASNIALSQEISTQLLVRFLHTDDVSFLYDIAERLINYSFFETLVLPALLKNKVLEQFNDQTLRLFTKIVRTKASPCLTGKSLASQSWTKYPLNISNNPVALNFLVSSLKAYSEIDDNTLRTLIVIPHLHVPTAELTDSLKTIVKKCYEKLANDEDNNDSNKWSFAFLLAIESLIHVLPINDLCQFIEESNIDFLHLISKNKKLVTVLNATDLYFTAISTSDLSENLINEDTFKTINEELKGEIGSAVPQVRLAVTHLFSLFSRVDGVILSSELKSALELPYLAECQPATVHTYRDKLLHFQAMTFESEAPQNLNPAYREFTVRYLIGNLHVNFSLIWEPVSKVLATYASKECSQFWPAFLEELTSTDARINDNSKVSDCDVVNELASELLDNNENIDNDNFKLLLWKSTSHFVDFCEMKNRDLTPLFVDYVNDNFFKTNSENAKYCCIEKYGTTVETEEMEEEAQNDEDVANDKAALKRIGGGKVKLNTLLAQMKLFSKMHNPKTFYRESDVHKIYMDLLSSKSIEIQKATMDCLFTYKHSYLLPYKEHLYNLIDEKNLKNELALFSVDQESNMIQSKDREHLIPILMKIIYSKMSMKIGMRTGGKSGGLVRRKIILRFLAGCQESEMTVFVNMAFRPFQKHLPLTTDKHQMPNLKQLTDSIASEINLKSVVPPKRLQSAVNMLSLIIEECGWKMHERLLPHLIGILLCILAEVNGIIRQSSNVHKGFLSTVKSVRASGINALARFFEHFENYEWSSSEIDGLFNVAVFPWLEKLPVEGIYSPTPLLKLLMAWSRSSRYFPLLIKHKEDDAKVTPLPFLVELLAKQGTHPSVTNAILEIIEKLLSLQDFDKLKRNDEDMEVDQVASSLMSVVTDKLPVDATYTDINFGTAILLPHVMDILRFIKVKIEKRKKNVNKTEQLILLRLSELSLSTEICDALLALFLPLLVRRASRHSDDESVAEMVTTVINLIGKVEKPEAHIRGIAQLFGVIASEQTRKLLVQLINTIADGVSPDIRDNMQFNCKILTELNAWDRKWIDRPDFNLRLDAFSKINDALDNDKISLEFGVMIIHNCLYFLATEPDLAMKDSSGECLKRVATKLVNTHKSNSANRRYLLDDVLLRVIANGLKSNNDTIRLQLIALLRALTLECADAHPVLQDLVCLTNKADPEVDFFENLQHLQLHRRGRALLKFCSIAKTLKKAPQPKTLTMFILPLASGYLCNESFANKNSIVDASIETVGTICKLLPWHHYEIILKYYLGKLRSSIEFQKQVVRTIVAILDSFHYDISKYKPTVEATAKEILAVKEPSSTAEDEAKTQDSEEQQLEPSEEQTEEDKLEEALNEQFDKEEEIVEEIISVELNVMDKLTLLSPYVAKKLVFSITNGLLPQLHRCIAARTRHESSHKVNRKKTGVEKEEDDLMRVPLMLAIVKLLQKLPEGVLDKNLPSVLVKICTFLKSRLDSVRRVARETLQKIMVTLGPKYLHHLLRELNGLLTKGFQVHVLVYTTHAVLVSLKPYLQPENISENLQSILSVCKIDLFGPTAEEKEVIGITKNVSEAKSTKSFDIFHILSEYMSDNCLLDLIIPLKKVLAKSRSFKVIHKVTECLKEVVLGLADNKNIPLDRLLIFLYGVASESIPQLLLEECNKEDSADAKGANQQQADCYLIPKEPKTRMGAKTAAKSTSSANAHIMVEFGLKLCQILLKRERIGDPELKQYLDPVVPVLCSCLKSQQVKLSTLALQCFHWLLRMDLMSIRENVGDICDSIFQILHKYATAGLGKGNNFDLVTAAFKCMSIFVRYIKYFTVNEEQLKTLVLYVEQDVYDNDRQATAFNLLKAVISRKLVVPEMHPIMRKISMLSITSESDNVRNQSRSVFYMYLMDYPLGKKLEDHLSFYLNQLNYELQIGRLSALEMVHNIITGFPEAIVTRHSGLFLLMIGVRLVNDDDATCRKMCGKCLKDLIGRVPESQKNKLFEMIVLWLQDKKVLHKRLAAQLCGIYVTVEKEAFDSRLATILPLLLRQFQCDVSDEMGPGRFVKLPVENEENSSNTGSLEKIKDHHLFQVLQLLLKMASSTSFLRNPKLQDYVTSLAENCQTLLAHPHSWVRLSASQFLGFVLATLNVNRILSLMEQSEESDESGYIYSNPIKSIRSLSLDLIAQIQPDMSFEELGDQVVKNLVFIASLLKCRVFSKTKDEESQSEDNKVNDVTLLWLIKRLRKVVNLEISQSPKSISVRTFVFKWIAGVVTTLSIDVLRPVLFQLMSPLVREISTTEESNKTLRHLAKEVANIIKKHLTQDEYIQLLNQVQQKLNVKRAERKKSKTQQFVTNPEIAAKRKIAKQQKKKQAKKRKIDTMKGKAKNGKRRRKEDVELDFS